MAKLDYVYPLTEVKYILQLRSNKLYRKLVTGLVLEWLVSYISV